MTIRHPSTYSGSRGQSRDENRLGAYLVKRETDTAGGLRLEVGGKRLSPPTFDLQRPKVRRFTR